MIRHWGNSVSAAAISKFRGNYWACVDRLPAPLRRALHESAMDWDAREFRRCLNKLLKAGISSETAVHWIVQSVRESDASEINDFSLLWPSRFGIYPHIAAKATIQRYDSNQQRRAT